MVKASHDNKIGIKIQNLYLTSFDYADDIASISDTVGKTQKLLNLLELEGSKIGLQFN